jgi:hypothetical protein
LWLTSKSLYYPLLCGDLIVETRLDLGDRLVWIRIERDPTLCELHNRDICILCGRLNFGMKSCVFVSLILIYFLFLFKLCSCLEFDLTLDLNPRVYVASSCSRYFSKLHIVLSGPRCIILTVDLLFCCAKFLVTGHIWPPNWTYQA